MSSRPRVIVTGASGFLGSALASRLASGGAHVFGLSRAKRVKRADGIEWLQCDLEDSARLTEVMRDMDVVFHAGGMVGHYGSRAAYLEANVGGTRNVIDACRKNGIKSLVFTSTPSVIADGTGHYGVDETHPYSQKFQSPYSESKALAERLVRAANDDVVRTVAIRPHMIWGPGQDSHWVGGLRKLAKRGMLYQVGSGTNRVGMTFMDDCVSAHVAAWKGLEADAAVGGQAFFVHGGTPISLWDWVRDLANALALPGVRGAIPKGAAAVAASACDVLVKLSRGAMHFPISRYLITELTTDHYSSIGRARAYLGYEPQVTVEEGIARMADAERASRVAIQTPAVEPSLTT